jgi:class 3 adenylate cyclase
MNEKPKIHQTNLPGGTVTFLFTDIEGSTQLLKQLRDHYTSLLADHHQIIREAICHWYGREVDNQGDSFFAAFPKATEAVAAVVDIQHALSDHAWPEGVPVRVRMGLHTGEPWLVEQGYVGMDVHRAARIGHVGHGGQVLLSETATALVLDELPEGVSLIDLGRHHLKDMRRPECIHQLVIEGLPSEFPPLNSLEAIQPAPLTPDVSSRRESRKVGSSPYRGLAAFREADAPLFFGREAFIDQLTEAVHHRQITVVIVGPSGSGKSSAVFAGLLPELREEGKWLIVETRPGGRPFHALAGALMPTLEQTISETDRLLETQKLTRAMQEGELRLFQIVNRALERHPEVHRMLLIIDQFEELFTHRPEPEDQQLFLDELLATAAAAATIAPAHHHSPLVLLLTLRADFMGQALGHRPFADALQDGSLILGPMNRNELQAAVEKPAELQGAAFETGLVQRILDDVGQEPGNLPLLEFALTLLWERLDEGWLTHAAYEEIGRVDGALARYAEEVYGDLDPSDKEGSRRLFVQLVQPGEGTEDTRRVARRLELAAEQWSLIQYLADQRLVVTGRDESGDETVEVVHEALIQGWDRLRAWMKEDRAFRTWQEGLRVALRGWEASGQDAGALLRGAPLAMALEWAAVYELQMSPAELAFIEASSQESQRMETEEEARRQRELETARQLAETEKARAQEQAQAAARQRRRAVYLALALAVAVLLAVAAVLLALQAQRERQNSERQAATLLASQAESDLAAGYHNREVLLALEALEKFPYTAQAERALGRAVSYNRALQGCPGFDSAASAALTWISRMTSRRWSPSVIVSTGSAVDYPHYDDRNDADYNHREALVHWH